MPIKLLLADDSVVIQKLVGLSFANEDIEIITVDNGDEAVVQAIESRPDVVLADVVMPGKSGYEVCSEIRNHPDLATTPVLMLTGTFEAFDEERAGQVGATGHISKPFEAQALVERVNEILSQGSTACEQSSSETATHDFLGAGVPSDNPIISVADDDRSIGDAAVHPMAEPGAETVALDADLGLQDDIDSRAGHHSVAITPDASESDTRTWMANPAAEASAARPESETPREIPTPDPTLLVDDWTRDHEAMPDPIAAPDHQLSGDTAPEASGETSPRDDLDLASGIETAHVDDLFRDDCDLSSSDLEVDAQDADPRWGSVAPAGVRIHPAPISTGASDLSPDMRDRIHDTLEKVAWEAFADLSDDVVRQLMQRVEQIAWEVIPQMAETLIQEEIRRMKGEEDPT